MFYKLIAVFPYYQLGNAAMFDDQKTLAWLMLGDPSIRWQTLRDLAQADEKLVRMEKLHVARTGWGARLLKKQDRDGLWAGSLYNRKGVSTAYTLLLLRQLGFIDSCHFHLAFN